MQSFTVHLPSGGAVEEATVLPDRWSWAGFVFGPLWLAYHRLWISASVFVVLFVVITGAGVASGLNPAAASALNTLLNIAVALEGNALRRWRLERKGQPVVAVIAARTVQEAEVRFFSVYPAARPKPQGRTAEQPRPVIAQGIIGLFPQPGGRL